MLIPTTEFIQPIMANFIKVELIFFNTFTPTSIIA